MPTPSSGYRLPNGDKVIGTTTIIGRFKDSGGLIQWAYKQGREHGDLAARDKPAPKHLYDVTDKAADIGTTVHNMVEAHIDGEDARLQLENDQPDDEEARRACVSGFEAYLAWEKQSNLKIIDQEMQLVCPRYRYGGTPDAIGHLMGNTKLCLPDWKTSNAIYGDYLIQLAAYKHLIENGLRLDTGEPYTINGKRVKIDGGFHICRFSKKHGDFSHHYFPNLDNAWKAFTLMRELYEIDKELKERTK